MTCSLAKHWTGLQSDRGECEPEIQRLASLVDEQLSPRAGADKRKRAGQRARSCTESALGYGQGFTMFGQSDQRGVDGGRPWLFLGLIQKVGTSFPSRPAVGSPYYHFLRPQLPLAAILECLARRETPFPAKSDVSETSARRFSIFQGVDSARARPRKSGDDATPSATDSRSAPLQPRTRSLRVV